VWVSKDRLDLHTESSCALEQALGLIAGIDDQPLCSPERRL